MRNRVFILTLSVIMVLCSSFSVFGLSTVSVVMSEPVTSDTQGYLVVADASGAHKNVFYWSIQPYKASETLNNVSVPSMNLIIDENSIQFTALHTGSARVTLTRVYNSNTQELLMSSQFTTSLSSTYTFGTPISDYCYYGNIGVVDDNISGTSDFLTVNWGSDGLYQEQFDDVVDLLGDLDSSIDNIYTRLGTTNSKLDNLADIEDKLNLTNGLLDDLFDELTSIHEDLQRVYGEMQNQSSELESIDNKLGEISNALDHLISKNGSSNTQPLDDSNINELGQLEGSVLHDNTDELDNLDLSFGSSFDVVWGLISSAWQSNAKVFTVVIMCLTIGLLKLIFNR